jgi:hypothetical protein
MSRMLLFGMFVAFVISDLDPSNNIYWNIFHGLWGWLYVIFLALRTVT